MNQWLNTIPLAKGDFIRYSVDLSEDNITVRIHSESE